MNDGLVQLYLDLLNCAVVIEQKVTFGNNISLTLESSFCYSYYVLSPTIIQLTGWKRKE